MVLGIVILLMSSKNLETKTNMIHFPNKLQRKHYGGQEGILYKFPTKIEIVMTM